MTIRTKRRAKKLFLVALLPFGLYDASLAGCLEVTSEAHGGLSTESGVFKNLCPAKIAYYYCIENGVKGGVFDCASQKFGAGNVDAGRTDGFSVFGAEPGRPARIKVIECKYPDGQGSVSITGVHYNGQQLQGRCIPQGPKPVKTQSDRADEGGQAF
jgi:hypothetical protein